MFQKQNVDSPQSWKYPKYLDIYGFTRKKLFIAITHSKIE